MSLVMTPTGGGNDNSCSGDYDGRACSQLEADATDEFINEMAKIRQNQSAEAVPAQGGKYKQKLEEARRRTEPTSDTSYKYPGYKARRRESLEGSSDEVPSVPAPASAGPSLPPEDVFSQVRTRRQEDLLKAARARKKTKEKKKAFGDQIKGVLAYLPFRTSHLSGFDV